MVFKVHMQYQSSYYQNVPVRSSFTAPEPLGPAIYDDSGPAPRSIHSSSNSTTTNIMIYPSWPPANNPHSYSHTFPLNYPQAINRPQTTVPHLRSLPWGSYSSPHSYSNSYSPPWSKVQARPSPPDHAPSPPIAFMPPKPPNTGFSSSYLPISPVRPFACDLCSLSFNHQHDLKRHRETHTGEKPFLCNGGCGKSFTRKDALKRHQVSIIRAASDACLIGWNS